MVNVHLRHFGNNGLRSAGRVLSVAVVLAAAPVVTQRTVGPVCLETGRVVHDVAGADGPADGQQHCISQ